MPAGVTATSPDEGLSQSEMPRRLGVQKLIDPYRISEFETGKREPPLPVLLRYAQAAGICTDVLIGDERDLPACLPGKAKRSHH